MSAEAAPAPAAAEAAAAEVEAPKLTKKQLRMIERERKAREEAAARAAAFAETFGDLPLNQSAEVTGRVWTSVSAIDASLVGKEVLVRGRVHNSRETGRCTFLLLRRGVHTIQAVVSKSKTVPKDMLKFAAAISRETIVDIVATVVAPPEPVASATVSGFELFVSKLHCVSKALPLMPFDLEDASAPDHLLRSKGAAAGEEEAGEGAAAGAGAGPSGEKLYNAVDQSVRLDHRWIDLRTTANHAIFRISSGVCTLYREFLLSRDFVEIQSPKLLGGASEGGSEVFRLKYFGRDACLAQSPQLYKQMASACGDLERVFEVGPVFRAENSNTHRHLCEFHGLDMEMVFNEHYHEVLDVFSDLFIYIFEGLNKRFKAELEAVRKQHPFEDLLFAKPMFRLTHAEAVVLLREAGEDIGFEDDFSTPQEKLLGRIVKEKYATEFYVVDEYPLAIRPFYTMPHPTNPKLSNSYDMFIRGEEILSGAQRVHDPAKLTERAIAKDIPVETIQSYVDAFKHGAYPHAGGGVGLERVVMLFMGLPNIRKTALFPRDPKRLSP